MYREPVVKSKREKETTTTVRERAARVCASVFFLSLYIFPPRRTWPTSAGRHLIVVAPRRRGNVQPAVAPGLLVVVDRRQKLEEEEAERRRGVEGESR